MYAIKIGQRKSVSYKITFSTTLVNWPCTSIISSDDGEHSASFNILTTYRYFIIIGKYDFMYTSRHKEADRKTSTLGQLFPERTVNQSIGPTTNLPNNLPCRY